MKCLFCEGGVPLLQSLFQRKSPFCGDTHRRAYFDRSQKLMLARLMDTSERYGKRVPLEIHPVAQTGLCPVEERQTGIELPSFVTG